MNRQDQKVIIAYEYYIENLKGKTLDDQMISKMKENALAHDLLADASRRAFVNDIMNTVGNLNELQENFDEAL